MKSLLSFAIIMLMCSMALAQTDTIKQEVVNYDSISITSKVHLEALPILMEEQKQLAEAREQLKEEISKVIELFSREENNRKQLVLIIAAYADIKDVAGISKDKIIVKK